MCWEDGELDEFLLLLLESLIYKNNHFLHCMNNVSTA